MDEGRRGREAYHKSGPVVRLRGGLGRRTGRRLGLAGGRERERERETYGGDEAEGGGGKEKKKHPAGRWRRREAEG